MSYASRIFVGAPKGVAGTAVSGRQIYRVTPVEYIPDIGVRVGAQPAHMDSLFAKAAKQTDEARFGVEKSAEVTNLPRTDRESHGMDFLLFF